MISRLKNLMLVFICLTRFIRKGRANKDISDPKKILVAQLAKMGDMVCTTPMFRAVKNKYPDAKLYVTGDMVNKELLAGNHDIDKYMVWEKDIGKMRKFMELEKFDVAVLTGPSPEALSVLYLSGIPLVISPILRGGYSPLRTTSYALLAKLVQTREHRLGNYAPREYLRLLEPIGIFTDDTKKHLAFSQYAEKKVAEFYEKKGIDVKSDLIIGIFPSTGNKIKLWAGDKFAKVADWIWEKYKAKIILIGSDADRKEVNEVLFVKKENTKIINAFKAFSVDELKAAISKMSIMISVDTGSIYIAEAFGVATIDIVGPVDENDQPPIGNIHKVAVAPRKKSEMGVFNARVYDAREARRQSLDITPEMVITEAEELIRLLDKPKRSR